jgi:hypothetical protein
MSHAIVIAGNLAHDVRVMDNSIEGALDGIHIGVSHAEPKHSRDRVDPNPLDRIWRAQVRGNSVALAVPVGTPGFHAGVFLGNVDSAVVEDNYVELGTGRGRGEGIRVFGQLGRMLRIHGNHEVGTHVGVSVTPLARSVPQALWIVSENSAIGIASPIVAPASVKLVNNAP